MEVSKDAPRIKDPQDLEVSVISQDETIPKLIVLLGGVESDLALINT